MKTKVAIIGCGAVARDEHIPCLTDFPDVELVAVCDKEAVRANSVAAQFNIPGAFTNLDELLEKTRPDLVHILTPPESHRDLAIRTLQAGAHVLVEKPFTYTVADADAVLQQAQASKRKLTVIHNDLFHRGIDEMKERIRKGEVGTICSVFFISGRRDQTFIPSEWYFKTHGGRLGETLPHAIYQLVEFFDDLAVVHVSARRLGFAIPPQIVDPKDVDLDDLSVELWSPSKKAVAHIAYSLNFELPTTLIIAGTNGSLFTHPFLQSEPIDGQQMGIRDLVKSLPGVAEIVRRRLRERHEQPQERLRRSSHYRQIREFVTAIRSGTPYTVTPAKAREVVRLWADIVAAYSRS